MTIYMEAIVLSTPVSQMYVFHFIGERIFTFLPDPLLLDAFTPIQSNCFFFLLLSTFQDLFCSHVIVFFFVPDSNLQMTPRICKMKSFNERLKQPKASARARSQLQELCLEHAEPLQV